MTALRRSASAELRAGRAAIGAGFYLASTAALLYALHRAGLVTIFSALAASGLASLVAAGIYALARPPATGARVSLREIAGEHWRYGRVGIGAGLLAWVPHNLFYFILPLVAEQGLAASANLRAAMNLVSPTFQINGALGIVLIPILGRRHRESPLHARHLLPFLLAFLAIDLAYWLVIVIAGDPLIELAYHGEYRATLDVLGWLAFVPVVTGVSTVVRAWAFALDYPEGQLWASFAGAAGALSAIPFLSSSPLAASAYGMLAAAGLYCITVGYFVVRRSTTSTFVTSK
jgi:O-antigen/teichoic acid export membrane protein